MTRHTGFWKNFSGAFTLSEVLLTLGIIGVVAAMTIPTLIAKHQHKVLETAFKKSYANLYNAVSLATVDISKPIFGGNEPEAGTSEDQEIKDFYNAIWAQMKVAETLKETYATSRLKGYTKKSTQHAQPTQSQGLITKLLPDGSAVGGRRNSGGYYFTIDTNGPKKGPNAYGHDLFIFVITQKSYPKIIPVVSEAALKVDDDGNRKELEEGEIAYEGASDCSKSSTKYSNGFGCTPYALKNICPDDETKTYWECLP